jgi:HlyD family secretion protein
LIAVVAVLVVATGVVFWQVRRGEHHAEVAYTLAPAEWGELSETVAATGGVEPLDAVAVGCQLSGQVVAVYPAAEVNAAVRPGDPLVRLDDRLAREKVEQAEAVVRTATADAARARAAHEGAELALSWQTWKNDEEQRLVDRFRDDKKPKLPIRPWELDKAKVELKAVEATLRAAEARLAEAQAALRQAQTGLDLTVVRVPGEPAAPNGSAPTSYTVLERKVVLGQLVAPPASAQLFTLATDLGRVRVRAMVSEDDIGRVTSDLPARFSVYAYPDAGERFRGAVSQVSPMPTRLHGLVFYETLIAADNSRDPATGQWFLRPGMTASVTLLLRTRSATWKVPTGALEYEPAKGERTAAAVAKLARWEARPDRESWRPVWVPGVAGRPWPVFVRVGGAGPDGRPGITDGRFTEAFEWDPDLDPKPTPGAADTHPRLIAGGRAGMDDGKGKRSVIKIF